MNPLNLIPWTIWVVSVLVLLLWLIQLLMRKRPPLPVFILGAQVGLLLWLLWLLLYGHDLRYDPRGFAGEDSPPVPLFYRDGGFHLAPREAEPLAGADLH